MSKSFRFNAAILVTHARAQPSTNLCKHLVDKIADALALGVLSIDGELLLENAKNEVENRRVVVLSRRVQKTGTTGGSMSAQNRARLACTRKER